MMFMSHLQCVYLMQIYDFQIIKFGFIYPRSWEIYLLQDHGQYIRYICSAAH